MKAFYLRAIISRALRAAAWGWQGGLAGLLSVLFVLGAQAQQRPAPNFFADDAAARQAAAASPLAATLSSARALTLNAAGMRAALATAPLESQAAAQPLVLLLPLPDGTNGRFAVVEAPIMEPALAAQFPTIKTYAGVGLDDPTASVRLDFTPLGFHAQVLSATLGTFYIDPAARPDLGHYLSFWKRSMSGNQGKCGVQSTPLQRRATGAAPKVSGTVLRTYRLAVAATGEYTAYFGGTAASGQAAIATTVSRVVGVYEVELSIRMLLVANNAALVYTNAATDPYDNSSARDLLPQNQTTIDAVIGTANYDIGHVFSTGGGGLAGLGVVGNASQKAWGETGLPNPVGDAYAIDYVAHEMGHQFGANHTFNTSNDPNRHASTAYEPGSGSTIMAYAGITGDDLQAHSDPYFHVASFEEILNYVDNSISAVGTRTATGNSVPVVSPGPLSYQLPLSTPFALTATGTDGNGDVLTYCWEEYDLGPALLLTSLQNTTSPLFRSFLPTTSPTRTFPRLADLVANTPTTSEKVPTLARNLKFRVTARDNRAGGGGVNSSDPITLTTVAGTGPFVVTAPNTAVSWVGNSTQTVTWNVAGTDANGINCAQVSLLLSTDGGFTYPTTLLASTANDGSETIMVPNTPTTMARVRVQAVGNVFFDISNANFAITAAPPVTAVSSVRAGTSPTNAAMVAFTVTFSGAVSGLTTNNFAVLTTGSVAGASVLSVTSSGTTGTTYTVAVNTGTGSGTVQLQLNNTTGILPTVSNVPFVGESYTIDKTAPTVAITSTAGNPTSISPIPVMVTFSEAVTGFTATDVVVTNGAITSTITNSGNAYSFDVTPVAAGPVTVNVAANGAQDAAGNGNQAASQFSITYQPVSTSSVWTGASSTDWFTAGNWTAGVPTATQDAIISSSSFGRQPVINSGSAVSKDLVINTGASLTMGGGTLDVRGDWANNDTFTATDGTVIFGATAATSGPTIYGSSASRFWNLTVQANGVRLSTAAGASVRRVLTLTGSLTTQGNPLTLESTATMTALVVNSGGVVVGNATVQRYIDPSLNSGLGYRHYSAPVSTSTVADLATPTGFSPVVNPAYNSAANPNFVSPFPNVFGYDESRVATVQSSYGPFDRGYFSPNATSDPLTPGRGYTVNIDASQVVDFVGTLTNGDQLLTLSNNRLSSTDAGWHLVGNPYPAPLDYRLVVAADRENLEGAIYVFSSTSQYGGQYRFYNNNVGNPVLPVGQGFFVRVAGTSAGALTFRNSQRLTVPNSTPFRRLAAESRPLVQLTLQGTGRPTTDETYIYFEAGATAGFDAAFDARKLPNDTGLNLSSGAAGTALAINGLPLLGAAPLTVPLAVSVPVAGTYALTADQLLNLPNTPVYLHDVQLGTLTDLHQQPSYTFTVATASALLPNRFELLFSPQQALATVPAALAQQVAVYPNPAHAAVTIDLPAALSRQPVTVTLVSALGQVVRQQELPAGRASHALPLADVAAGVYSLRLSTEAGIVVKKVVVD